ncbi:hypothetical protein TNCV_1808331 [Trichonephila clavipes]|nr:hypothetical protein TNCV_1808331 [Trichonephila clavipes]
MRECQANVSRCLPLDESGRFCGLRHYSRAFGDRPSNFEPWSNDEDGSRAGTPSPNFHTTSLGGCLNLNRFNMHRPNLHGESSVIQVSNSWYASHRSVTLPTRLPHPYLESASKSLRILFMMFLISYGMGTLADLFYISSSEFASTVEHIKIFQGRVSRVESLPFLYHAPFDFVDFREQKKQ